MSKKWITLLVAAVIGALLLPTAAFANCSAALVGQVRVTDATTVAFTGDPAPLPGQDNFTQIIPQAVTEPILNNEGQRERILDILVWDDDAAGTCFKLGNQFQFTVNGQIISPAPGAGVPAAGSNLDVYDSSAATGLLVSANSFTAVGSGNVVQTIIQVTVNRAGTVATAGGGLLAGAASTGAAFRIKNIRIDDSAYTAGSHATWALVQGPASLNAITFDLAPPVPDIITALNGVALNAAGVATKTLVSTGNTALNTLGVGTQSSGTGLTTMAIFPNLQENANGVFRLNKRGIDGTTGTGAACTSSTSAADTCVSGVANDIATVPTSLVFAVSAIPSGVTVTFPSTMSTSAAAGAGSPYITWTSTSRGGSPLAFTATAAAGSQVVVYDTTHNDPGAQATGVNIESADNADPGTPVGDAVSGTTNPNCKISSGAVKSNNVSTNGSKGCDTNPKIGVVVGAASQAGTSVVSTAFGRGVSSLFTGDDVAAAGDVPAYTGSNRRLVKAANFFTINPTRTTLLFPFVAAGSTTGAFNTGIEVASTGSDVGVFGNTTATATASGGLTFYFVGTTSSGTAVTAVLNTDLTNGGTAIPAASCPFANLDSNGRLVSGKSFACGASALLALTGTSTTPAPTSFSGYVIAVLGANYGHGFSVQFNGAGAPYAASNALVLEQGTGVRTTTTAQDGGLGQ